MEQNACLAVFANTTSAMQAADALRSKGVQSVLLPTPREFTAGCGLSLRFPAEELSAVRAALTAALDDLALCRLYAVTQGGDRPGFSPLEMAPER